MNPVIFGTRYRTETSGWLWRPVRCEHCGCEYIYEYEVKGRGGGLSPLNVSNAWAKNASLRAARNQMRENSRQYVGIAFCPRCGWYQRSMVAQIKRFYWKMIGYVVLAPAALGFTALCVGISNYLVFVPLLTLLMLFVIGETRPAFKEFGLTIIQSFVAFPALFLIAMVGKAGIVVALVAAVLIVLFCLYRALLYDPNQNAKERTRTAKNKHMTMLRADFEKLVEQSRAQTGRYVAMPTWPEK